MATKLIERIGGTVGYHKGDDKVAEKLCYDDSTDHLAMMSHVILSFACKTLKHVKSEVS